MVYLKYVGSSALDGVPARDLTKTEADLFGVEKLLESGLYVRAQAKMERPAGEDKMVRRKPEDKRGAE